MTETMTAEQYRAEVRKQKQMPREKAALHQWLQDRFGDDLMTEYRFHPTRRWRFDWALPEITALGKTRPLMVAIEFDGLYGGGAHTSVKMVAKDSEKLNQAAIHGWIVIRVNSQSLRDGSGYRDIEAAIAQREGA